MSLAGEISYVAGKITLDNRAEDESSYRDFVYEIFGFDDSEATGEEAIYAY